MSVRIHYYKTWPEPFEAAAILAKLHEIRKDDRNPRPAVGDMVVLREWRPSFKPGDVITYVKADGPPPIDRNAGEYTGRELAPRRVTYISEPGTWGLPADVFVMTLIPEEAPR